MIIYGELLLHNNLISMLMKKYAKWVGIVVLTPFVLILLLAVLLYLPPVQKDETTNKKYMRNVRVPTALMTVSKPASFNSFTLGA